MPHGQVVLKAREPLRDHTTFRIGGPATLWYEPVSGELPAITALAHRCGLPMLTIGDGSNCLVSDQGYDGIVIRLSDRAITTCDRHDGDSALVSAGADRSWDDFVTWCCANGYQGVECMAGIPGTVGGAVVGAIGAYGQRIADVVSWVREYHPTERCFRKRDRPQIGFAYRWSDYQSDQSTIITEVGFRLSASHIPRRTHPDAASITPFTASLSEFADAIRRIRARKGAMLWLPQRGHNRSAGSFFKNPTLTAERFERDILSRHGDLPPSWYWPDPLGYRVSAAFLIEHAGFQRGYRIGDAAISPEHTLQLINLGSASASEVIDLARHIRDGVHDTYGVLLVPEVRLIGFQRSPLV